MGLPPGIYSLTVEAPGFAILTDTSFALTLGQAAEYNPQLQLQTTAASVSVSAAPDLVETSKTDVSMTVTQNQIDNLPINGRNYINFTLLDSRAARDNTPSIGAAPNTGLNVGGQRGRSNEISVDGADAIDSSVNGVRATVSQEGVQEFQVITNSYMPEYGRAMGGVVNIVTKSGSNEFPRQCVRILAQRRHSSAKSIFRNGIVRSDYISVRHNSRQTVLHARADRGSHSAALFRRTRRFSSLATNSHVAKRPDSPRSARTISASSIPIFFLLLQDRARFPRIW